MSKVKPKPTIKVIQPKAWEVYYSSEKYPRGRYALATTEQERQTFVRAFKMLGWAVRVVPVYQGKS